MTFDELAEQILREATKSCPPATQNIELNTKNRNATIENHMYGPLNIDEPDDYWDKIAAKWDTSVKAARQSLCGNCVAFDVSPAMKECMPGEVSDDSGELGYCWMHHFKCHSARTCDTWAKGGPITDNKVSQEWQDKNTFNEEDVLEEGPKDASGKSIFVKKIAKSSGVSYDKAGAIAAAAGRKRMGAEKFNKKAAAGRKKAAKARKAGKKYKG